MLDYYRDLLADSIRMNAYREAIRRLVRPGSVVVDIGSGTGALAALALEAGARTVYAIERLHAADFIPLLSKEIRVIHDDSKYVTLPERADVLISETIGGFGLDEGIAGSIVDARQRLLEPDAVLIPQRLRLFVAAVEHSRFYERYIASWDEPFRTFTSNSLRFDTISPNALLSAGANVATLMFDDMYITGQTRLTIQRPGTLHGFAGWFSATLAPDIELSNECGSGTHWSQAFLALPRPVDVDAGTVIDIEYQSHDGAINRWKGTIGTVPPVAFDQATRLSRPVCLIARR